MKLHKAALTVQRKYGEEPIKNQFDERDKLLDDLQFQGFYQPPGAEKQEFNG